MLSISELPLIDGVPQGSYRLRLSGSNEAYPGVRYENGVSVEACKGRTVARQYSAFGPQMVIEAWDQETLSMVVSHLRSVDKNARADELEGLTTQELPVYCKQAEPEGCGFSIEDIKEMDKEDLVELLKKLGGKVAKSSTEKSLREKIADRLGIGDE